MLCLATPVFAIEDVQTDNIKAPKCKFFCSKEERALKKQQKQALKELKTEKQNQEKKQPETDDINKNLLTPNVAPGIYTDSVQSKKYYQSLEEAHRAYDSLQIYDGKVVEPIPSQLPARINKSDVTAKITKVEISKSEIFTPEELDEFINLVEGQEVTPEDLNNLIGIINDQYKKRNVLTARASLMEGDLSDGILRIELMEARIGKVYVEGNRFNRKWFLKKMISRRDGKVLDLQSLENDLRTFNKNARSIQLSAKLKPGEEYGTTDVIINAKEKFPYHFSASYDSFGRETTGLLRGGLMASTDSLFGFQDRLTGAINMARSSTNPFVDYNFPINRKGTRVGASYIYGNNSISSGQYKDFDLRAKTHIFSTYITHPLKDTERFQLNLNASANIKLSDASISGYKYSDFHDYNIAVGLGGRYNFNKSVLFGSVYSTNGIIENRTMSNSNYFTKVNADGYYVHYLPKGIIATLKIGGQYSPNNIPYVEQYQIGGISSVRGYTESLLLAPSSYFVSLEMLFPIPFLPEEVKIPFKKGSTYRLRDSVKFATFFDHGAVFAHEGQVKSTNFLASVGAGIRIAISKFVTARFYVGVPLMNAGIYDQSSARVHFDLIVSPF